MANKKTGNLPGRGPGRPKGSQNRTTAALKDAILLAGAAVGADKNGAGGLQGYLETVAKEDMKAFSALLGKVLPLQVTGENGASIGVVFKTVYESKAD